MSVDDPTNVPMPISFAFSSAAAAAILAASRESVGRLFVADMSMDRGIWCSMNSSGVDDVECDLSFDR